MVYPSSQMQGGGEVVAAWMVQALATEHALSILAWEQLHLEDINRGCGTSLKATDYALIKPDALARGFGRVIGVLGADAYRAHRYSWLMRLAREAARHHDLLMTPLNEADLGGGGIQYVHEPWTSWLEDPALGHQLTGLDLGRRAFRTLHRYSAQRMRTNLTLANSAWSAKRIERELGVRAIVVTPPAPGRTAGVPWERREQAVIAVGRIVLAKRFDEIVEIVARLREAGIDLRLHIVGWRGDTRRDTRYLRSLRALVDATSGWATLHENLPRIELLQLLGRVRYGLHACREEPFGIAVAEMVRCGCIPFGHRSGGIPEIVGTDELLFSSPAEAVDKLGSLISSPERQRRLRDALAERAEEFSEDAFMCRIREVVRAHAPAGGGATAGAVR